MQLIYHVVFNLKERILVASESTQVLDMIYRLLVVLPWFRHMPPDAILKFHGNSTNKERADFVNGCNGGNMLVGLLSTRAGGVGLTLTGAHYMVPIEKDK